MYEPGADNEFLEKMAGIPALPSLILSEHKEILTRSGVEFLDDVNSLFVRVALPDGWAIVVTGWQPVDSMLLKDDSGRIVATATTCIGHWSSSDGITRNVDSIPGGLDVAWLYAIKEKAE